MAQLTLEQRCEIEIGYSQNQTYFQIGTTINKDKSVVWREIKRNSDDRSGAYKAVLAHKKASKRHSNKGKKKYFTEENKKYVKKYLKKKFSPEQIVGQAIKDGISCVSHETIYKYIWRNKKAKGKLYTFLRNRGKRYRKRGRIKDTRGLIVGRVDISQRPELVDLWHRLGDLEIDLIIGKNHNQALLTINDRASGVLFMAKVDNKTAIEIEKKTIELLKDWQPLIHTITSDNGKEFGKHASIAEELNLSWYFAKPYHSWQRGANENLNGLVRQYFPKNHDFSTITNDQIKNVQNELNNRPRKRFGFKTPNEIFASKLNEHLDVAFIG